MRDPDRPSGNTGTDPDRTGRHGGLPDVPAVEHAGLQRPGGATDEPTNVLPPDQLASAQSQRADPPAGPGAGSGPAAGSSAGRRGLAARVTSLGAVVSAPFTGAWHRLRPPGKRGRAGGPAAKPGGEVAGAALARLTVWPAVLIVAWLLPGLPLLLAGTFQPLPALLISVPLAVALTVSGLRLVPSSWPRSAFGASGSGRGWATWFGLLATVAVVAGLTAWQLSESSDSLVVLRDPGTYLQTGYWIAQHGSLPIPQTLRAFGGAHPGLGFASSGFAVRGTSVVPGVTAGLPMLLAIGFWAHGTAGALAVGPVLGGLAALAFAGLVARLVGPQWAPAGAAVLGLSLPEQYVSRSAFAEPALQILLFGGLCLLIDSLVLREARAAAAGRSGWQAWFANSAAWLTPGRTLAGLAGLALGLSLVVSLDGLLYVLPIIPFGGALLVLRWPQALSFLVGTVIGAGYGAAAWFLLSRPLLFSVKLSAAVAGVAAAWLVVLCVVVWQLRRLRRVRESVPKVVRRRPLRWLPEAGAVLVLAVLIGFAVRPYVQTVHGHPSAAVSRLIASLQRAQGLHVDPTRLYSEQTLYWVIWYIGLPTVLLGGFGAALLTRRCLRAVLTWRDPARMWRTWGLPLAIICAASAVVLWDPAIVPDQPWASRRLVVMVLPGLIVCGLWAASWLAGWARERGARPVTAVVAGTFCVAAMLVPVAATTFGVGFTHSGRAAGLQPVVKGMALERIGTGETAAVAGLCAQIPRSASVVILDSATAAHFTQVIRGMCGVPTGSMVGQSAAAVRTVLGAVAAAGRRPVLLASGPRALAGFGSPVRVLDLKTTQDPQELTQLPTSLKPIRFVIWMATPSSTGVSS